MFRNMNQVDIDAHKFKAWLSRNKLAITSVSEELGHGKSYLSSCLGRRKLPLAEAKLLGVLYGLSIDDILPDPPQAEAPVEWSFALRIAEDRIKLAIIHDGEIVGASYAYRKDSSETAMLQAISYAAWCIYKQSEKEEVL